MNIVNITKKILHPLEVKYNFCLLKKAILITYNNDVFITEHNQSLNILLKKDINNIKGWSFSENIIGYSLYGSSDILYLVFNGVNSTDCYISIKNMKILNKNELTILLSPKESVK